MATKGAARKAIAAASQNASRTQKTAAKKTGAKKAKAAGERAPAKRAAKKTAGARKTAEKDPAGGLTAAGRAAFRKKEGAYLRPGVQGAADTPEKQKRKGSFLRRHFANPRGPMVKDVKPTRLALSAHAWGEPVPKTLAAARKLAAKGTKLLKRYQKSKDAKAPVKSAGKKRSAPKTRV